MRPLKPDISNSVTMAGTPLDIPHVKLNDGNEIPVVRSTPPNDMPKTTRHETPRANSIEMSESS